MSAIKKTLIIIGIGILVFELAEHVILPLVWYMFHRKKEPLVGAESMIGKEVEVIKWENLEGQVLFRGVLWKAAGDDSLTPGEKAVIEETKGLTLRVKRGESSEGICPE